MRKNGKIIACDNCGIEKYKPLAKLKRAKNYFCSHKCFDIFRRDRIIVECKNCGKKMDRVKSKIRDNSKYTFCSRKCQSEGMKGINLSGFFQKGNKGDKCINYKGGTQIYNGYIAVLSPEHPFANKRGYVYQHRLVMEKRLGRYLTPEEVVHHIDFNKQNNNDDNLMLFATDAEHHRYHGLLKKD